MIVRDNAATLPAALASIRPWVDEMVVVDTGSTDATPEIAAGYGARVFHFPWCDDFAAARNESLRHARGDWLFWMDSDDTIPEDCGRKLRELIGRPADPSLLGYVMQVHCPGGGPDGGHDVTVVDHVKLVRNRPDLRFEGRIHEQILPSIRRAGGEVAWTDLYVVHSGSDPGPEAQRRKRRRDLRLLHLEDRDRPNHTFTLFNLGMTHADGGEYDEAIGYLERSVARATPGESHLRKAYALLVYCLAQRGRRDEALGVCDRGLGLFPDDVELRFRRGVLLHDLGRLGESAAVYEDLLAHPGERHFTSVDRGITGFKARQNLAVAYTEMGDLGHAEDHWRRVTEEEPGYRAGWRGLVDTLLRRGRFDEAEALAERLSGVPGMSAEALLARGRLAAARGDVASAAEALRRAAEGLPDDPEPLRALCQLLFEHGPPDQAEAALEELARRHPDDPAARHNLGSVRLRAGRPAEAVEALRESLRIRPEAPHTLVQLGHALKALDRHDEAADAWRQAALCGGWETGDGGRGAEGS
jgi:tetratricopeptide (TPR) repeat protein